MRKKKLTAAQADELRKQGATVTSRKKAPTPKPAPKESGFLTKEELKTVLSEVLSETTKREPSRLVVNRDSRGFIETIDVIPIGNARRTLN